MQRQVLEWTQKLITVLASGKRTVARNEDSHRDLLYSVNSLLSIIRSFSQLKIIASIGLELCYCLEESENETIVHFVDHYKQVT